MRRSCGHHTTSHVQSGHWGRSAILHPRWSLPPGVAVLGWEAGTSCEVLKGKLPLLPHCTGRCPIRMRVRSRSPARWRRRRLGEICPHQLQRTINTGISAGQRCAEIYSCPEQETERDNTQRSRELNLQLCKLQGTKNATDVNQYYKCTLTTGTTL